MDRSYIEKYALYKAVIVETINGDKFKGWLVPDEDSCNGAYLLLPLDDFRNTYLFNANFIKEITHLTNNVAIGKLAEEIDKNNNGIVTSDTRKIRG